ncbi:CBS domain-containing protein [Paenibacillus pedocola]|uniref:CBS domain-containing protein n=1 Tax=Paenibacillus pedocola TaxID=3242193 RepID=UPI0028774BDD|nr:CBS domain-containing protein [Paenibacillus typhae]
MSTVLTSELSAVLRSAPSVPASLTCRETMRVMFQHPESKCIVVCNEGNEPVGILMCERFFLRATGRMGTDHFYRESITKLMNRKPLIADLSTPAASVLAEAMNRPDMMKNDCIIITSQGKLAGVIYPSDMLCSRQ